MNLIYLTFGSGRLMIVVTQPFPQGPQMCQSVDELDPLSLHRTRRGSLCYSHSHKLLMANTFLFREPILSRELCLYLIALGKDCTSLLPLTSKDERVLLMPFITPKLLTTGMDLSVIYGRMESVIRPAQECLLILHSAQEPSEFLCYKPHVPTLQGKNLPTLSQIFILLYFSVVSFLGIPLLHTVLVEELKEMCFCFHCRLRDPLPNMFHTNSCDVW